MKITRKAVFSSVAAAVMMLGAAVAQAQTVYQFSQSFNDAGVVGTLSGTFSGVDANGNNLFDSPPTFLTLNFTGNVSFLGGAVSLSYAPPDILVSSGTNWSIGDTTLGQADNGFNLAGLSTTGAQLVWLAGPSMGFSFGNNVGMTVGGDPQNHPDYKFGTLSFYDLDGITQLGLDSASRTYVSVEVAPIPEPATYMMMLLGVAGLAFVARRKAH